MTWRRSPRRLTLAIEQVRDDLAPETLLARVQQVWPEAVGGSIAAQASPAAERGGVLTVSCSASVWAHELDLMAPVIVDQLNDALGGESLTRLRCVTGQPSTGS